MMKRYEHAWLVNAIVKPWITRTSRKLQRRLKKYRHKLDGPPSEEAFTYIDKLWKRKHEAEGDVDKDQGGDDSDDEEDRSKKGKKQLQELTKGRRTRTSEHQLPRLALQR